MPRNKGITLVGFLVAALLMSVVLIPIFMLFQSSRQTTSNSLNSVFAAQLIDTQIEKLKGLPFRKLERYITNPTRPVLPDGQPDVPDIINGPFEHDPEEPDIVENGLVTSGGVTFDRLTYIAYFPYGNPEPSSKDFFKNRQRIRIRVLIRWEEPGAGSVMQSRKLAMATLVENEMYHPKPALQGRNLPQWRYGR